MELLTFKWFTCVKVFSLILRDCAFQPKKMHCGSDVPRSSWLYKMSPWRKKGVLLSFCSVIINLMVLTWWVKFRSAERYKYRYDTIHLSFVALDSFEWKEMKWRGTLDTIISYILVLFTQDPLFLNFLDLRLGTKKKTTSALPGEKQQFRWLRRFETN